MSQEGHLPSHSWHLMYVARHQWRRREPVGMYVLQRAIKFIPAPPDLRCEGL